MSNDIFLKLDGIDGDSTDSKHGKEIVVLSWSWGASNSTSLSTGGGLSHGKVDLSHLSITKELDSASTKLFVNCCTGTHVKTGVLTVRKSTGAGNPEDYFQVKLNTVFVTSYQMSDSAGGGHPVESISLGFEQLVMDYKPQDDKGGLGASLTQGWNLSKNAKV